MAFNLNSVANKLYAASTQKNLIEEIKDRNFENKKENDELKFSIYKFLRVQFPNFSKAQLVEITETQFNKLLKELNVLRGVK